MVKLTLVPLSLSIIVVLALYCYLINKFSFRRNILTAVVVCTLAYLILKYVSKHASLSFSTYIWVFTFLTGVVLLFHKLSHRLGETACIPMATMTSGFTVLALGLHIL